HPVYHVETSLLYGNDAAPDLSFSRTECKSSGYNEKQLEKYVSKKSKSFEKLERKSLKKNGDYTKLGNDEFEALFGGTNRDHEIQFRLLFSPLAQKNMLKLLKDKENYGDDFSFIKQKCINKIISAHSQQIDYSCDPLKFVHYDYEKAKEYFIKYNEEFFKGIYFDLAPLLSVPLYQQHKSRDYIYKNPPGSNLSSYEHESIANSLDISQLKNPWSDTKTILKTNFLNTVDEMDQVNVTAHSFQAVRRLTYVPTWGADGRMHHVPVFWIDYLPVSQSSTIAVQNKNSTRFEFNSIRNTDEFKSTISNFSKNNTCVYKKGIFATVLARTLLNSDVKAFNTVYKGSTKLPEIKTLISKANEMAEQLLQEQQENARIHNDSVTSEEDILNDETKEVKEEAYNEQQEIQNRPQEVTPSETDIDDDIDLDDEL
ncbi:MAG: MAG1210 family protein, partial [Anaeroplasmataceae bacterium]